MFSIVFRTIIMFALMIFTMRIMGKKNLGEFQPSDLVSTILISNLTSLVIEAPELPIINSIVPILIIMCLEVFLSLYVKRNEDFAHVVQGKAMILVQNGMLNQKTMQDLRFSVDDVLEALRGKDIFYIEEVCLAIVETTGKVNVYKDPNANSNIKKDQIPALPVIVDGRIIFENLVTIGFCEEKLNAILSKSNIKLKDILLMTLDGSIQYNITPKEVL